MSASISVQVGPAITCVRSTTFNPVSGPMVSPAILLWLFARLFAGPLRLALVEKSIHAFAEIPALVTHQNQVFVFVRFWLHAMQALLGGPQRQRRVARDEPRQFIGPSFKGGAVLHHFIQQAEAQRFFGFDRARGKNDLLEACRSDQCGEPAEARHRQTVAERAGDWKSEFRGPVADAEVAARGNPGAATGASAIDRGNRRDLALLQCAQYPINPCLVVDGILRSLE